MATARNRDEPGRPLPPRPAPGGDAPLAVIVDDSPVHRALSAEVLRQCGFAVEEVEDGGAGLRRIRELRPDLVVLELLIKTLDGFSVCEALSQDPATAGLPVLVITALDDLESVERAFQAGASDFLTKPVNPSLLLFRIKYMMKAKLAERELRLAKQQAEEAYETIANLSRRLERQIEDRTAQLKETRDELLEKERQLRQSQKMDALGQLAGGIAHEFNNQLTVISGFSRAALNRVEDSQRVHDCLDEIVAAADRAVALTSQMLIFSRDQVMSASTVDVGDAIRGMTAVLRSAVGATIETRIDIGEGEAIAEVDQVQLSQAVLNLAVNARDAMPQGGSLTIGCHTVNLDAGDRVSHYHGPVSPGCYVRVYVQDSGTGIDAANMERIFDPFFTTKDIGKGTGLGLSVVFGIVEQCGGMIDVRGEVGMGTTFSLYFPVAQRGVSEDEDEVETAVTGGAETILVVEDEEPLLDLVKMTLLDLGYEVLTAADGVQAMEVIESGVHGIDLLVTDVVMPRMGGIDLANGFEKMYPGRAVVYMSGYAPELNERMEGLGEQAHFLRKPFKPAQLADLVRRILDTEGGESTGPRMKAS